MKTSLQIARFGGIPLRLHWTFGLLLPAAFALSRAEEGFSWILMLWNALFIGSLFACVVMHEYGHALMARHYGIGTQDILLTPIGGIARLQGLPSKPAHELAIAIAGPLVNVVIVALLAVPVWYFFTPEFHSITDSFFSKAPEVENRLSAVLRYWPPALLVFNIVLALFNLLPAFPMDGGRILRALLNLRTTRLRATRIASRIGQLAGLSFILIGFKIGHWGLIFIGTFVIITAAKEYRDLYEYERLRSETAGNLMKPSLFHLSVNNTLAEARALLRQTQTDSLPVLNDEGLAIGQFKWQQIPEEAEAQNTPLNNYLLPWPGRLLPEDNLLTALQKLHRTRSESLPVFQGNTLLGLLSKKDVSEWMKKKG